MPHKAAFHQAQKIDLLAINQTLPLNISLRPLHLQ